MKRKKIFEALVGNAFDFLETAISEFKAKPKYSVIHFTAAVELFLKARLLAEHWTLVVTRRKEPDWKKFIAGEFISVGIDEAFTKLENVLQDRLSDKEKTVFRSIADHRNRMIHFFHEAAASDRKSPIVKQVASEQCVGWYHLKRLLTERWKPHFRSYDEEIQNLDAQMKGHREYLKAVYENNRERISQLNKRGVKFIDCPSCKFDALELSPILPILDEGTCLVCDYSAKVLRADCAGCGEEFLLIESGWVSCPHCGLEFDPHEGVKRVLNPIYVDDVPQYIQCLDCDTIDTVGEIEDTYLCVCCFSYSDVYSHCKNCGTPYLDYYDDTISYGCASCDGALKLRSH